MFNSNNAASQKSSEKLIDKLIVDNYSIIEGIELENKIKISPTNRSLIFIFQRAGNIDKEFEYSYYLDGFDENWSRKSHKTEKEYTNLDPGNYIFYIKAYKNSSSDIITSQVNFSILPPWYMSKQAYIIYIFLLLLLLWFLIWLNTKRLTKIKLRFEKLVIQRTQEIVSKKEEIEFQHEEMKASLRYARTIQQAVLSIEDNMDKYLNFFLIYRPKEIVSGDFYWFSIPNYYTRSDRTNDIKMMFAAVVDCTGHGVPGAFMSMLGIRLFNEIVNERKIFNPAEILNELDKGIIKSLRQDKTSNNDGMDISLCKIEYANEENESVKVTYSGAKSPLYYIVKNENKKIVRIKGTFKDIGGTFEFDHKFENQEFFLNRGDLLYLTSDGYIDQNNSDRIRFGTVKFMKLLRAISSRSLEAQKNVLKREFDSFRENEEQRDDITVLGIKL